MKGAADRSQVEPENDVTEIHRDLPREGDRRRPALGRLQRTDRDAEGGGDEVADDAAEPLLGRCGAAHATCGGG
jgi:hypothetical protein